ncbi:MAG: glycosyltransferase [Geminicoccaceae bacterium]|jgi:hypothetical protein|nr:glycosyltransferase [Geminicoccaceae bacterium]
MSILTAAMPSPTSTPVAVPELPAASVPPFLFNAPMPPLPVAATLRHDQAGWPAIAAEVGAGYLARGLVGSFEAQAFGTVPGPLDALVTVPARNEAGSIRAVLTGLRRALAASPVRAAIVLFANNCDDGTAGNVAELAPALGIPLVLVEGRLRRPHAHVGLARRIAMDIALGMGTPDCAILTTDADTRVGDEWVRELTAPLAEGFELVCGDFEIEDPGPAVRGLQLHPLWRMEARYAALQNRVQHACDQVTGRQPVGGPCPHYVEAGASLGITARLYRRLGGLPPVACSEDRALVRAAELAGARICYAERAPVRTSGRLDGRAAGGLAATLSRRLVAAAPTLDQRLRPATGLRRLWTHALLAAAGHERAALEWPTATPAALHARMENEWQRSVVEPPMPARVVRRELPRLARLLRLEIEPALARWAAGHGR